MKNKQIILTPGGQPVSIFISVVSGQDNSTGKKGFLVYGFKANQPEPTTTENGFRLIDTLFGNEEEALKAGEKIVTAKVKADYNEHKKALAATQKSRKSKR